VLVLFLSGYTALPVSGREAIQQEHTFNFDDGRINAVKLSKMNCNANEMNEIKIILKI